MTKSEKGILYFLVFALLFGVLNIYCQGVPFDNNAAGFILAGFGVLVTALIGWQIYSALGIDRRVYKAEKRIANMLSQLQAARERINTTSQSSEDYTSGVNCLSVAMVEFIQTKFSTKATIEQKAKHYCTCYMVSANAIRFLIDSNKNDELLFPIITMCVEGIELSSELLFSSHYLEYTKREFTKENHDTCEKHYQFLKDKVKILGVDNHNSIVKAHKNRVALLN